MKKKIMLIDDSVTIHRVIDLCVDKEKFDVVKVFTKDEALNILSAEKPDLILLDNKLGDISAKDMISLIRSACGKVVIILLTGAFDQFDSNLCFILGADDFIYKPFDAKTLDSKIAGGLSGESRFETIDAAEAPTDEELFAAMTQMPVEKNDTPLSVEPLIEKRIQEESVVLTEYPAAAFDLLPVADTISLPEAVISADDDGAFVGLIEVDEDQLFVEEERRKESPAAVCDHAARPALPVSVPAADNDQQTPESADSSNTFEGLIEVSEELLFEQEEERTEHPEENPEQEDVIEIEEDIIEIEEEVLPELTAEEQEELFKNLEEPTVDELDNILDGINEEHTEEMVRQVEETLINAEDALDETVETVLTDIQAELSLSDALEEHGADDDSAFEQSVPNEYVSAAQQDFSTTDVKDIDPEPMVRISEEKLVEAVYEAIDEDVLKFAIKEVLSDKITRILEDELPVIVERAIKKEIERLVKGK